MEPPDNRPLRSGMTSPDQKPPTIALMGWARLPKGAAEGGGLNQVVTQLARGLVQRGHRVLYMRSGLEYSLRDGTRVEAEDAWQGIECYSVVNSPNLSIGAANFENVREQIASPEHSRLVAAFLREQRVDVFHLHVFEGVGFDLVDEVRKVGVPVVVTPHNYAALCPQVDLLHQERMVCDDYEGGQRCVACLKVPDFAWEKRRRARVHTLRRILTPALFDSLKPLAKPVARAAAKVWRTIRGGGAPRTSFEDPGLRATPFHETLSTGQPLAHERLLANADRHLVVLNNYGERRRAGVAAMNRASLVLAPSEFLSRVHEAMGVQGSLLRHTPLGLAHLDALRARAAASKDLDAPSWGPATTRELRLVFFGNCWVNKGLCFLVDAMCLLDAQTLARVRLDIFASGDDRPFRERLGKLAHVTFHGAYDADAQARALDTADVGVFPGIALENSPLVIQEMLAMGRFVVASRRGAMEEFVIAGRSGTFFNPGDAASLASTIASLVRGDVRVPTQREVMDASPRTTFTRFVDLVERAYADVRA